MTVGNNIKNLRQEHHLLQKDLAKLLNLSAQAISSWEINRTEPSIRQIDEMCKIFNCKRADIIGSDEYPLDYTGKPKDALLDFADMLSNIENQSMPPLSSDEKDLLELWRNASLKTKMAVYNILTKGE